MNTQFKNHEALLCHVFENQMVADALTDEDQMRIFCHYDDVEGNLSEDMSEDFQWRSAGILNTMYSFLRGKLWDVDKEYCKTLAILTGKAIDEYDVESDVFRAWQEGLTYAEERGEDFWS